VKRNETTVVEQWGPVCLSGIVRSVLR